MKRKKYYIFLGIVLSVFILVIGMNIRYPFVTPAVGKWSVGYHFSKRIFPKQNFHPAEIFTYELVDSLVKGNIHYLADPFFIKEKDNFFLFVELKGEGNADIALFTAEEDSSFEYQGIVLDEPYHLSYPQVFKYKEEFYMLPETKGSNNVLLYKAKNFPYEWIVEDTLLKNRGLKDPSILLTDDLNLIVAVDDNLKQYMFTADSLRGKWTEVENYEQRWGNETRPGGRFFQVEETWYLPVQNRSKGYGTGISIYELENKRGKLKLTMNEKLFLGPQKDIVWFNRGMHHLDVQKIDEGYFFVYDGDRKTGIQEFQYKRTLKFNFLDFYNFLRH
ncbi:hypothetical protein V6B16_13425 [Salinimicrobium catena]|uniref:glucosamine inositolphosphorylceramide transferase family protein n=1 Tax=Salinimicrobium catena TaxID=390640 RepID=UPI002FE46368